MILKWRNTLLMICIISFKCKNSQCSVMDWLFGVEESETKTSDEGQDPVRSTDVLARNQRFEMLSTDDKFQSFAKSLSELSPLDECYHIVVYSLKRKCGSLTEEDLGKLAVQLLNCQSEAEDRPVFPCTNKMTIKECTRTMDATTWNAYQIVSNRARAMCYATQQHQFRRLTEITVSQLVTQANNQLDNMKQLQSGQDKLHDVTSDTMRKMYSSQKELMGNQETLKSAQLDIYSHVAANLAELSQEKALIATGNRELAIMTDNIRSKLDEATDQMTAQENRQKVSHEAISGDLQQIREKAQSVIDKIDHSSSEMIQHHLDMLDHYRTTLDNLAKINSTINYLLDMISDTKMRIGWLAQHFGGAEDKFGLLTTAVLHLVYFLLAAVSAAFLQTPALTRAMIMILVPLNAVAEVKRGACLDFTSMTLFIVLTVLVNWTMRQIFRAVRGGNTQHHREQPATPPLALDLPPAPDTPLTRMDTDDIRQLTATVDRLYRSLHHQTTSHLDSGNETISPIRPVREPWTPENAPPTPMPDSSTTIDPVPSTSNTDFEVGDVSTVRRRLTDDLDKMARHQRRSSKSRSPSRCSTPIRSSRASSRVSNISTSSRPLCLGTTKSGVPCRNPSIIGKDHCHRHRTDNS